MACKLLDNQQNVFLTTVDQCSYEQRVSNSIESDLLYSPLSENARFKLLIKLSLDKTICGAP